MLSPDRCHTSVHMALELQTTPDPLVFVLVLNIQAPGAVKHQCSALMEKGGWKGHSSEGEERRSQAGSLVEDLLELCKGISEKMHLGLFSIQISPLSMLLVLSWQSCWSPCGPPHTVALCSWRTKLELQFPNVPLLAGAVLGSLAQGCCLCAQCLSHSRLSPPLEQEFRPGHQCQMGNQGVLPIQDMLKGNVISLTCSSRFYIKVTFRSLPFPLQF